MSKDLKDQIDTVDKLKFTVNEQKLLIEDLKNQLKDETGEKDELPSEIGILKDLIISQRKDLNRRNNNIEKLNEKIDQLNKMLEYNENGELNKDELLSTQKLLVQLTDENEGYKNEINLLQKQLKGSQSGARNVGIIGDDDNLLEENEHLINIKKLNFQLMEENGILRVELESFKTKLADGTETGSEYLELANNKIEILTAELEDYEAQVKYLNESLVNLEQSHQNLGKEQEDFDKLKDELLEFQRQSLVLNEMTSELEEHAEEQASEEMMNPPGAYTIPTQIPLSLFNRIYNLLNERQRKSVKSILIQDLNSEYVDVKRNAIKILSQIKGPTIYDAFIEMINDKDWLTRLYIVKALSKFETKRDNLIDLMKELSSDADVDVRELAVKVLYDITNN